MYTNTNGNGNIIIRLICSIVYEIRRTIYEVPYTKYIYEVPIRSTTYDGGEKHKPYRGLYVQPGTDKVPMFRVVILEGSIGNANRKN